MTVAIHFIRCRYSCRNESTCQAVLWRDDRIPVPHTEFIKPARCIWVTGTVGDECIIGQRRQKWYLMVRGGMPPRVVPALPVDDGRLIDGLKNVEEST